MRSRRRLSDYARSLKYLLDPLASPYSPLIWISERRLEGYYRRALSGPDLATAWVAHYLDGLTIAPSSTVLDHGCGRGRICAFLSRAGFRVVGQDVVPHPWWPNVDGAGFAVVPATFGTLPWADESFDLVLNSMVIGHLTPSQLKEHAGNVWRVLKPGGYWVIFEANSLGMGAAASRRFYGRLHSLQEVRRVCHDLEYQELGYSFEGIRSPVLTRLVAYLRSQLSPGGFDIADHGSRLERVVRPERRAMWLLRLQRAA